MNKFKEFGLLAVILIIIFGVYGNSLKNYFVYDDAEYILKNPQIRNLQNIRKIFSNEYFKTTFETTYRPVVSLSYFFDYFLWRLNAWGWHLTNVILHILCVISLFILVKMLFLPDRAKGEKWNPAELALLACLFFGLHPVNTEAVNVIGFREELLSALFLLSGLIFYLLLRTGKPEHVSLFSLLSSVMFILALFSKEIAVCFPLLILLIERIKCGKNWKYQPVYTNYLFIIIFYFLLRFFFFPSRFGPYLTFTGENLVSVVLTLPRIIVKYLILIFYPANLCADYSISLFSSGLSGEVIFYFFLLGAMVFAFWYLNGKSGPFIFSFFWIFFTFIPIMNLFTLPNMVAERYLYLPLLGFAVFAASIAIKILDRVQGSSSRKAVIALMALILTLYTGKIVSRNRVWNDNFSLWKQTVVDNPTSVRAHLNLGKEYLTQTRHDLAINEFQKNIQLCPDSVLGYYNLGVVYQEKKDTAKAEAAYLKALELNPRYLQARNNLALLYRDRGEYEKAILHLEEILSIDPNYLGVHNNLASVYFRQGKLGDAILEFKKELKSMGEYKGIYYLNIDGLSLEWGNYESEIYINLAKMYSLMEDNLEAIETLKINMGKYPELPRNYFLLSQLYNYLEQKKLSEEYRSAGERKLREYAEKHRLPPATADKLLKIVASELMKFVKVDELSSDNCK